MSNKAQGDVGQFGNVVALRNALDKIISICSWVSENCNDTQTSEYMNEVISTASFALSTSPRNCDKYPYDEALNVWAAEAENKYIGCFNKWLYASAEEE